MINEGIFRAYDIRGIYPSEINEETVYLTAKAYAEWLKPKKVALGRDVRTSGESLFNEAKRGLTEMGVDVVDIGVITSDMLYFAVAKYSLDGGISVTASHNEAQYNGLKVVGKNVRPISIDSGLKQIEEIAKAGEFVDSEKPGRVEQKQILEAYAKKILSFVDPSKIKPMKVVVNPNFGAAGKVVDALAGNLKLELVKLNFEEDGTFPKGKPDPSMPKDRKETLQLIKSSGADLGVIWDGDADRCIFMDEKGVFVEGCYTASILAQEILRKHPGAKMVCNASVTLAFTETVKAAGGIPITNKVGHTFITERMIKEGAAFGSEVSGHYSFKGYWSCDNGMIPFVMMLQILSISGKKLSELVAPIREKYPVSGDINFEVVKAQEILHKLEENFRDGKISHIDGLSVEYPAWRFNIRASNTEPLVRLNVEAKTKEIVDEKVKELKNIIEA